MRYAGGDPVEGLPATESGTLSQRGVGSALRSVGAGSAEYVLKGSGLAKLAATT